MDESESSGREPPVCVARRLHTFVRGSQSSLTAGLFKGVSWAERLRCGRAFKKLDQDFDLANAPARAVIEVTVPRRLLDLRSY
jgi:hypothetical protein